MNHDPMGRGIGEAEYQRSLYLASLIEADQEDQRNYELDNRWEGARRWGYIPFELLENWQIEDLNRLQRAYELAVRRHRSKGHVCRRSSCIVNPKYPDYVKKLRHEEKLQEDFIESCRQSRVQQ